MRGAMRAGDVRRTHVRPRSRPGRAAGCPAPAATGLAVIGGLLVLLVTDPTVDVGGVDDEVQLVRGVEAEEACGSRLLRAELREHCDKQALPALTHLFLYNNNIGDDGVKALMAVAARGRLQKLEYLYFSVFVSSDDKCDETTAEAIADVIEDGQLPALRQLSVFLEQRHPRLAALCDERDIDLEVSEEDGFV